MDAAFITVPTVNHHEPTGYRYDYPASIGTHWAGVYNPTTSGVGVHYVPGYVLDDSYQDATISVLVTSPGPVVPVPSALVLAAFGLLTAGAKLRRHKR